MNVASLGLAGLSVLPVVGLIGYHVASGEATRPITGLPSGISAALEEATSEADEAPVKANVVVFRKVAASRLLTGFMDVVAAHHFDRADDPAPTSGWCYVELAARDSDGVEQSITLATFDGKSVSVQPASLRGFATLGLGMTERDLLVRACPWTGLSD